MTEKRLQQAKADYPDLVQEIERLRRRIKGPILASYEINTSAKRVSRSTVRRISSPESRELCDKCNLTVSPKWFRVYMPKPSAARVMYICSRCEPAARKSMRTWAKRNKAKEPDWHPRGDID